MRGLTVGALREIDGVSVAFRFEVSAEALVRASEGRTLLTGFSGALPPVPAELNDRLIAEVNRLLEEALPRMELALAEASMLWAKANRS